MTTEVWAIFEANPHPIRTASPPGMAAATAGTFSRNGIGEICICLHAGMIESEFQSHSCSVRGGGFAGHCHTRALSRSPALKPQRFLVSCVHESERGPPTRVLRRSSAEPRPRSTRCSHPLRPGKVRLWNGSSLAAPQGNADQLGENFV